jgi:hypothetical protein
MPPLIYFAEHWIGIFHFHFIPMLCFAIGYIYLFLILCFNLCSISHIEYGKACPVPALQFVQKTGHVIGYCFHRHVQARCNFLIRHTLYNTFQDFLFDGSQFDMFIHDTAPPSSDPLEQQLKGSGTLYCMPVLELALELWIYFHSSTAYPLIQCS